MKQAHNIASATITTVKNAEEAKSYLFNKGWILRGENYALDTLARTLFAAAIDCQGSGLHTESQVADDVTQTTIRDSRVYQGTLTHTETERTSLE